jgi:hypothetical protein
MIRFFAFRTHSMITDTLNAVITTILKFRFITFIKTNFANYFFHQSLKAYDYNTLFNSLLECHIPQREIVLIVSSLILSISDWDETDMHNILAL